MNYRHIYINESCIYLICSSEESYEIMEKSYNIRKGHLLKMEDILNENPKKKFDIVIMNPPYGLNNSVAKKITKKILNYTDVLMNLVPKNIYKDTFLFKKVETIKIVNNVFNGVSVQNLSIAKLKNNYCNTTISFESLCFNKQQVILAKAIHNYNKTHKNCCNRLKLSGSPILDKMNKNLLNSFLYKDYKKDLFENVKDFTIGDARDKYLLFATTVWTPLDGVHINQAHDWVYNLRNEWDDDWDRMCPLNFFVFPTKKARDNFSKWWYSCLQKQNLNKKQRVGLTNACLDLIRDADSSGGSRYLEYFPQVDWSRTWTDEEISEEIGLPRNFLNNIN